MEFHRGGTELRESTGKGVCQSGFQRKGRAILDTDVVELRKRTVGFKAQYLAGQAIEQFA